MDKSIVSLFFDSQCTGSHVELIRPIGEQHITIILTSLD